LTEREESSVADANNRVAEATAEAERLVQEATEHSAELIRRAAAESYQRVADADQAVQELTTLRSHVLDQLAALRDHIAQVDKLAASAPALLDPPDTEAGRTVTADFPIDPEQRPTGLPEGYDGGEPGPWDQVTVASIRSERAQEHRPPQEQQDSGPASQNSADDGIEALAKDFSAREPSVVPLDSDEFETDTFPRVQDDEPRELSTAPSVPGQQRGGLRAFAERAMGNR
jgi:hypothetical protein